MRKFQTLSALAYALSEAIGKHVTEQIAFDVQPCWYQYGEPLTDSDWNRMCKNARNFF